MHAFKHSRADYRLVPRQKNHALVSRLPNEGVKADRPTDKQADIIDMKKRISVSSFSEILIVDIVRYMIKPLSDSGHDTIMTDYC